jgi:hypothetical protein
VLTTIPATDGSERDVEFTRLLEDHNHLWATKIVPLNKLKNRTVPRFSSNLNEEWNSRPSHQRISHQTQPPAGKRARHAA